MIDYDKLHQRRFDPEGMVVGKYYRVRILVGSTTKKEFVGKWMGMGGNDGSKLMFSLRPVAGTQTIEQRDLLSIWETDAGLSIPYVVHEEVRVF